MRVNNMRAGERYTLEARDTKTDAPATVAFTLLCVSWFPSETKPGAFYHGAMAVTNAGVVAILDFMTLEVCQPLLALPTPRGA
jgi:hypothetical protein